MKYINLTPRWLELFSTWQMIVNDAVKVKKPDQMERFWETVEQSFIATDRYNDLVAYLRAEGWTEIDFESAFDEGRNIQESERNKVHEEEENA